MKRITISILAVCFAFIGNATAQEKQGTFELSPYAGIHTTDNYNGPDPDIAPLAGLRLGYFLTEAFQVEVAGQRAFGQTRNVTPYFGEDIDMDSIQINLAYHFLNDYKLQPYVSAGAGYAHIDSDNLNSSHDMGVNAGLGFRLFAGNSAGIRVEGRYAPVNFRKDWQTNFDVTGGLFFLFGKKGVKPAPVVVEEKEEVKVVDADADGDGVLDSVDTCPSTPVGTTVNAQGCPVVAKVMDADGDGVADADDKCADTPAGASIDAMGCALDSDGDGVKDYADRCADTPSGSDIDANGCPVQSIARGVLNGVTFKLNSAELSGDSSMVLNTVAAELLNFPNVKVEVQGHTDNMGDPNYNMDLSQRRAQSVLEYLVSRGVDRMQLSAQGYGITLPSADNGTREGRAQNRRVELNWLD